MARLSSDGYFDSGDGPVIAGVAADSTQRGEAPLRRRERSFERHGPQGGQLCTLEGDRAQRGQALAQDLSFGRFIYEQRPLSSGGRGRRLGTTRTRMQMTTRTTMTASRRLPFPPRSRRRLPPPRPPAGRHSPGPPSAAAPGNG
jgi:hypothetical protein